MSGIELSEMTEDLVFDDRPAVQPKKNVPASQSVQESQPGPAHVDHGVTDPSGPFVSAKVRPAQVDVEPVLDSSTSQPSAPAKLAAQPLSAARPLPPQPPAAPQSPTPPSVPPQPTAAAQPAPPQPAVAAQRVAPLQHSVSQSTSATRPAPPQPPVAPQPATTRSMAATQPAASLPFELQQPSSAAVELLRSERKKVRSDSTDGQKKEAVELFETLIASAAKGGASDLLLKRGQVPMFRWNGELFPSRNGPRLESTFLEILASAILTRLHCERLEDIHDVDFSYQSQRGGRIRINVFHQCGELGLVARLIPNDIPTFEKLEMDIGLKQLVEHKRGLVLVTGATGSGKSTTLAALLDHINSTRTSHIITIEDPIEFIHHDKRSMFNQRELGLDTRGYADALRSALRQAPDVILVGELRDSETMEVALQAAETGHLVLSTLHTNDAADAILRILGLTGQDKEAVVRSQLADCLRGVISQRLVKRADRPGRIAAQEIMINTATIRERLLKGAHPSVVRDFISQGSNHGMRTFDQHLIHLVKAGIVDYEEALRNASNREDFILRFNGVSDGREAS